MRNEFIANQILKDEIIEFQSSSFYNYGTQNSISVSFNEYNGIYTFQGSIDKENWFDIIQDNKKFEFIGHENNVTSKTLFYLINTNAPWLRMNIQFRAGSVMASIQNNQGSINNIRISRA